MKTAIFTALVMFSATQSYALDLTNARQSENVEIAATAPVEPVKPTAVPQTLLTQFKAVCDSKAVKSKKLVKACETGTAPLATKKGDRFKMGKNGAEVTFIFANLELINN